MRKLLSGIFYIVLISSALAEPELKGSPNDLRGFLYPNDNIVSIQGYAEEKAYSDQAIISLVITTDSKLLSDAIAANGDLRASTSKQLIAAGIDATKINSSKFSSSPQYGWFKNKPSSYEVVNRMAVTINDSVHLQVIAKIADQSDNIELSDTAFEHSKKEQFNEQVKAKALDKILKQKTFYEETLGVTLTPIGIRDAHIQQGATRGALVLENIVVAGITGERKAYTSSPRVRQASNENSFDEVKYQANISVDFKIEK